MKKRRKVTEPLHLAKQYISEHEMQVMRQVEVIERLKQRGSPTTDAERDLKILEVNLLKLRNHRNIMRELIGEESDKSLRWVARFKVNE
ncbi:MAG TPA: hypothetical protein VFM05_11445 [Candidatus Saccharimonadales bacterium]|nr:hypothetical protein [Candidatus Saccharimonadales bacterium]